MTYQEWVDKIGYPKAQKRLGFAESTLRMWYHFHRFPRPRQLVVIMDNMGGLLDLERWVRDFDAHKLPESNEMVRSER
ncbi:hypothetical protein ABMX64_20080 [Vibrio vulnificus]|uniref:hypothetical protein n=1 Tax=Vibrio vulnificus TaxID=672 RepID=UPI001A1D9D3C|nr:hypothetical protein [Vibrio vulnificus]EGQ7854343.1 hypothetical protein [Vibrio vulnificus]EIE1227668.1 hypothetical protein [Vibrio vulnificus]MDK2679249.1 hypothetical protein [Vibrio vulnificus]MDK2688022.1 hypothetical protein [Vibrio vulnificus]